jgi:hypothetical protein
MKIEQLLVQHFYLAKKVTLQGIGTFTLSPDLVIPADSDKDVVLPEDAVSFAFNPRATEDDALINYIVQQSRKMKPLASADLESYLMLSSQFLNIGKPFKIEGIGMLEKSQTGEYMFSPGQFVNTKVEDATVQLKEKSREDVSFGNEARATGNNKKTLMILAAIIGLAAIALAAWFVFNNSAGNNNVVENTPEQQVAPVPVADTVKKDSSTLMQPKPDSAIAAIPAGNSNYSFKVVLKNYPSLILAQKAFERLTGYGHKLLLYTSDSVTYKVAMPIGTAISDSARAKDSVRILFGGKPYIEIR